MSTLVTMPPDDITGVDTVGQAGPVAGAAGAPATGPAATTPAVEPATVQPHPLRAQDVPALLLKRIG